jgi:hypothetical protein
MDEQQILRPVDVQE